MRCYLLRVSMSNKVSNRHCTLPVFSLKGWNNLAQGNALGMLTIECSSLKGWDKNGPRDCKLSHSFRVH
jgi:hypothetical protein